MARLRSEVDGLEREASALGAEQSRQHQMLAEMERTAESEGDPARRAGIEQELAQIRMQIRLQDARLDDRVRLFLVTPEGEFYQALDGRATPAGLSVCAR